MSKKLTKAERIVRKDMLAFCKKWGLCHPVDPEQPFKNYIELQIEHGQWSKFLYGKFSMECQLAFRAIKEGI